MSGKSSASLSPAISLAQRLLEAFAKVLIVELPSRTDGLVKRKFGARDVSSIDDASTQLISGVVYTVENECGIQADIRLEVLWYPPWMRKQVLIAGYPVRKIDGEVLRLTKLLHRIRDGEAMKPVAFKDWHDLVKTMTEGAH